MNFFGKKKNVDDESDLNHYSESKDVSVSFGFTEQKGKATYERETDEGTFYRVELDNPVTVSLSDKSVKFSKRGEIEFHESRVNFDDE